VLRNIQGFLSKKQRREIQQMLHSGNFEVVFSTEYNWDIGIAQRKPPSPPPPHPFDQLLGPEPSPQKPKAKASPAASLSVGVPMVQNRVATPQRPQPRRIVATSTSAFSSPLARIHRPGGSGERLGGKGDALNRWREPKVVQARSGSRREDDAALALPPNRILLDETEDTTQTSGGWDASDSHSVDVSEMTYGSEFDAMFHPTPTTPHSPSSPNRQAPSRRRLNI
jgi:hypothetical protein